MTPVLVCSAGARRGIAGVLRQSVTRANAAFSRKLTLMGQHAAVVHTVNLARLPAGMAVPDRNYLGLGARPWMPVCDRVWQFVVLVRHLKLVVDEAPSQATQSSSFNLRLRNIAQFYTS